MKDQPIPLRKGILIENLGFVANLPLCRYFYISTRNFDFYIQKIEKFLYFFKKHKTKAQFHSPLCMKGQKAQKTPKGKRYERQTD
jgi:hypothetical protein